MLKFKQMNGTQKADHILRNIFHFIIIFALPLSIFGLSFYFNFNISSTLILFGFILVAYHVLARVGYRKKWYWRAERPFSGTHSLGAIDNFVGMVFFGQVMTIVLIIILGVIYGFSLL